MAQSSFDFLAKSHRGLYGPIVSAEQYAYSDPVASLMKARQFVEFLVFRWLASDTSRPLDAFSGERRLKDEIDRLRSSQAITDVEYVALTFVRRHGNDAVHRDLGDSNSAVEALQSCYLVAVRQLWPRGAGTSPNPRAYRLPPRTAVFPSAGRELAHRAWIIRPYPHYQDCREVFRRENMIAIGWHLLGRLSGSSSEQLADRLRHHFPDNRGRWDRDLETILLFLNELQENDLVVMAPYRRDEMTVAIGQIAGPYIYRKSESPVRAVLAQQRPVVWLDRCLPRQELPIVVQRGIRKLTLVETSAADLLSFCHQRGYRLRVESRPVDRRR